MKPFALELYDRYLRGESPEQLSVELRIPVERVTMRLRAAAAYLNQHRKKAA